MASLSLPSHADTHRRNGLSLESLIRVPMERVLGEPTEAFPTEVFPTGVLPTKVFPTKVFAVDLSIRSSASVLRLAFVRLQSSRNAKEPSSPLAASVSAHAAPKRTNSSVPCPMPRPPRHISRHTV